MPGPVRERPGWKEVRFRVVVLYTLAILAENVCAVFGGINIVFQVFEHKRDTKKVK